MALVHQLLLGMQGPMLINLIITLAQVKYAVAFGNGHLTTNGTCYNAIWTSVGEETVLIEM